MGKASEAKLPAERLLTVPYVAFLLDVTPRTIQKLIERKEFSRVVYITPSDVRIPESVYQEFVLHRTVNLKPLAA